MITQPWHVSQNIDSGGCDLQFQSTSNLCKFISLILSYGKDVRVLEPKSLIDLIKEQIEEMTHHYRKG